MKEAVQFGLLVRNARKAHKLAISELAERASTGAKHLGRIERGEKSPSFELIIALAKAMDVSPEIFFRFDDLHVDPTVLRNRLRNQLSKGDLDQLRRANRVLQAILEP